MCHWVLLIGESFEVLSDHDKTTEDDVVGDESSDESTGTVPPLPLVSCREFRKHGTGNDCRDSAESSLFDCWDWRHEQSDISATCGPLEDCILREGLPQSEFPFLSCVSEIGRLQSTFCPPQLPVRHPTGREIVDLTKYQMKSLRVKSGCLKW